MSTMTTDTSDFLTALLFTNDEFDGKTPDDFTLEFRGYVDEFIIGFEKFLESKGFKMNRLKDLQRSFGGNVYFSLSGHGRGFFDEYGDPEKTLGDDLQSLLEEYSGNKHRFEALSSQIMKLRGGKITLHYKKPFMKEYFEKIFVEGVKTFEEISKVDRALSEATDFYQIKEDLN